MHRYTLIVVMCLLMCMMVSAEQITATLFLEMTDKNDTPISHGSGFFVTYTLIATNAHVIKDAIAGTATLVGKNEHYSIQGVVAVDPKTELVLLKVEAIGVTPYPLGDSDAVKIGDTVHIVGSAEKGLKGIIDGRGGAHSAEHFEITTTISPKSIGAPVLNSEKEVIGVCFKPVGDGQERYFAIPSNALVALLNQSRQSKPLWKQKPIVNLSAEYFYQSGRAHIKLKDYRAAISDFTKVITYNPNYAEAYYSRANIKRILGQHADAILDYDVVLNLNPDPVAYYHRGFCKQILRRYSDAMSDFDTAITIKPDYAAPYNNRGNIKMVLGQNDAAIADYETAMKLDPDNPTYYYNRGIVNERLKRTHAAIADYSTAIKLNPKYIFPYLNRGHLMQRQRQYDAAIADFDAVIKIRPDYARAYLSRAFSHLNLRNYEKAIPDFDIAIKRMPDNSMIYYHRGRSKFELKQFKAALADFNKAGDTFNGSYFYYYYRGSAKYELGQYAEAIVDLNLSIQLNARYPFAYHNRGKAKAKLEQYDAAIQDYDRAIDIIRGSVADFYYSRGDAKVKLGQSDAAIMDYAMAAYSQGNTDMVEGNIEAARKNFRTAVRLAEQAGGLSLKMKAERMLRDLE